MASRKKQAKPQTALITEQELPNTKLSETEEQIIEGIYSHSERSLKRWYGGNPEREDVEDVFHTFIYYPSQVAFLIPFDNVKQDHKIGSIIDYLEMTHRYATEFLVNWAARLNLNCGLIKVSGEYAQKVINENPGLLCKGNNAAWPYCLDNNSGPIPAIDYQHIKEAEVVLEQLRQQLTIALDNGSVTIKKLFQKEGNGDPEVEVEQNLRAKLGFPVPSATHSSDFSTVQWYGTQYDFTKTQAACVKVLWEAWDNKTPGISEETILEKAGSCGNRLRDVFNKGKHLAWDTMIVKAGKGRFQLQEPKKV